MSHIVPYDLRQCSPADSRSRDRLVRSALARCTGISSSQPSTRAVDVEAAQSCVAADRAGEVDEALSTAPTLPTSRSVSAGLSLRNLATPFTASSPIGLLRSDKERSPSPEFDMSVCEAVASEAPKRIPVQVERLRANGTSSAVPASASLSSTPLWGDYAERIGVHVDTRTSTRAAS